MGEEWTADSETVPGNIWQKINVNITCNGSQLKSI